MARRLIVEIFGNASQFAREMDKAADKTQRFSKAAGLAGTAITGGLVVALTQAAKGSMEDQVQMERLTTAFKNVHVPIEQYTKRLDDAQESGRKLGFVDEDVVRSVASLVTATHDGTKAFNLENVAMDLARFKHQDLESATKMLTAAMAGNVRAAKQLGIIIPKNLTDPQEKAAFVIEQVRQRVHGQAEAFASTASGGMQVYSARTDELKDNLGKSLLPAIEGVTGALVDASSFFAKHETLTKALVIATAALGATLLAVGAATKIYAAGQVIATAATAGWTAAQWLLNAALTANPIGLVIVALVALGAALFVAWTKSETFRKIVTGAFDAVKKAAGAVMDFFRSNWPEITTLISGPFIPVVALATDAFGVRSALVKAFNEIKTFTSGVVGDIAGFWKELPGRIGSAIGGAMGDLKTALQKFFDWHKILGWIKDALDFHSPAPWAVQIGKDIVGSIAHGVGSAAGVLKDAVTGMAQRFLSSGGGSGLLDRAVGAGSAPYAHGLVSQVLHALTFARQHGWHGSVISGFRTRAEQEALYARYVASGFDNRYIAARPGTSSHEFGQAVDVSDASTFDRIMAMAPAYARLMNNVPGDFSHFSVSGRAAGGPVVAGVPYVVGERGRELFVPSQSGHILPGFARPSLGGGDTVIHSVLQLDGRTVYESWKKQAAYDVGRNGGTGIRA